jgi:hypothetical protein
VIAAGEYFSAASDAMLPLWFRVTFSKPFGSLCLQERVDAVITVHRDGSVHIRRSRGAAEHV